MFCSFDVRMLEIKIASAVVSAQTFIGVILHTVITGIITERAMCLH
jgi:hypothetical protein